MAPRAGLGICGEPGSPVNQVARSTKEETEHGNDRGHD
jgi:hypothetical protein